MIAVGHSILIIISCVLRDQKASHELGGNSFDEQDRQAIEKRLVRRLEKLGYEVSLKSPSPAA
jgi:transposase